MGSLIKKEQPPKGLACCNNWNKHSVQDIPQSAQHKNKGHVHIPEKDNAVKVPASFLFVFYLLQMLIVI